MKKLLDYTFIVGTAYSQYYLSPIERTNYAKAECSCYYSDGRLRSYHVGTHDSKYRTLYRFAIMLYAMFAIIISTIIILIIYYVMSNSQID